VAVALMSFPLDDQVRFSRPDTRKPLNEKATVEKIDSSLLEAAKWAQEFGLDQSAVEFLIGRHGAEALDLLVRNKRASNGRTPEEKLWEMEARHAIAHTMCLSLSDFYFRRVPLFLAKKNHGLGLLAFLSQVFAAELGWNEAGRLNEVEKLKALIERELQWKQSFGISPSSF
jgi:glycerol-3-phosphate dehydrogenase